MASRTELAGASQRLDQMVEGSCLSTVRAVAGSTNPGPLVLTIMCTNRLWVEKIGRERQFEMI